jgi:HlyD family secretion protein
MVSERKEKGNQFRRTEMRFPAMLSRSILTSTLAVCFQAAGCSDHSPNAYAGYVEGKYVYVASAQSGRLVKLWVGRGDSIQPGQPLFQLEDEPEADAKREAEWAVGSSEARLADMRTGKRPPEVNATRAQLAQAQAESKQAADILNSDQEQYKSGGISLTDLINARGTAESDAALVQQLDSELAVALLPAREQQVRAQMEQVKADRAQLKQAEWRLEQKRMASPRSGLVFDTIYREGEWIPAGDPVVQLLPPENVELRFFVPESNLGEVRVGQRIAVSCDGCTANLTATVTFISPQSEYTPPIIYSNERRSKLVFVIIAKPPIERAAAFHPGEPVQVTLE